MAPAETETTRIKRTAALRANTRDHAQKMPACVKEAEGQVRAWPHRCRGGWFRFLSGVGEGCLHGPAMLSPARHGVGGGDPGALPGLALT